MTEIKLRSDMSVTLIDSMGSDQTIAQAARASTGKDTVALERIEGLIRYLMRHSHTSPFEHCVMTIRVECPIFVAREWERHRTQSYSELSMRFEEARPEFYIEPTERPLINEGSGAHPKLVDGDDTHFITNLNEATDAYGASWNSYSNMLAAGLASEVARKVLPVGTYTTFWATGNLNNWFKFLHLRNGGYGAPQWEIVAAALLVEEQIAKLYPVAYAAWKETYGA